MPSGDYLFAKLHPPGGLYRYKGDCNNNNSSFDAHGWRIGKVYFLVKWQIPEGFSKKTSMLDAIFLVNGQGCPVDINFFRYLERIE